MFCIADHCCAYDSYMFYVLYTLIVVIFDIDAGLATESFLFCIVTLPGLILDQF